MESLLGTGFDGRGVLGDGKQAGGQGHCEKG
jgi:hypothetical protein